ncbi:MAG: dTDP-4-dehydrorhamnose reductase [Microbacterium sp.]|nr:dTDP-4-dehydrorhamnose reductase [Microbacterium sp.]
MSDMEYGKQLAAHETTIPGLTLFDIPVHGDNRGWFKENWQREKMVALGLPDLGPVQNNISFNRNVGTTRGIHAEPWDKFISVATGRVFGAWVDLRAGDGFGTLFTAEIDPSVAIFVPRGVGNAFQTLEADTAYTYLVNDHWTPEADPLGRGRFFVERVIRLSGACRWAPPIPSSRPRRSRRSN